VTLWFAESRESAVSYAWQRAGYGRA